MKKRLFVLCTFAFIANAHADEYVQGYTRSNGSYVQPHYQTAPDNSVYNNYSTKGNVNPYTGQQGNVDPYQAQEHQQVRQLNSGTGLYEPRRSSNLYR